MDLPIKFPNDSDVIAKDAARWRELSPREWMRSFRGMLRAGALLVETASNQEFLRQYRIEQKELARPIQFASNMMHGRAQWGLDQVKSRLQTTAKCLPIH